ncbi:MAG: hypothetical protein H7Y59_15240 [Anaerolineales bacterium]|nr:hypothetical protein [Anaerolineales bacterium]
MTVQYQVNGNIFSEITATWLCVYVNEFMIKARQLDIDEDGNTIEYFQLNDGRVFSRLAPNPRAVHISKVSELRRRNTQPAIAIREHSVAHSG